MQYAPLGSLEDYLAERSGTSGGPTGAAGLDVKRSGQDVEDVKAAFRARRGKQKPVERSERRGVRLMGKAEIDVIFGGIVRGLGYLVRFPEASLMNERLTESSGVAMSAQPRPPSSGSQVLERAASHRRIGRRLDSSSAYQRLRYDPTGHLLPARG